jgi:xylulokinase
METGRIVRQGEGFLPETSEIDPEAWWQALAQAGAGEVLDGVAAMAIAGPRHATVMLDAAGAAVSPVLFPNGVRGAVAAADLVDELGGPMAWVEAVGMAPRSEHTVAMLRWFVENEPELAVRVVTAVPPHVWLAWRLLGGSTPMTTDRASASASGYWSPLTGRYHEKLVESAFGRPLRLPEVTRPAQPLGTAPGSRMLVSAGSGEEAASALGMSLEPGDAVISIDTLGTVFAVHPVPGTDPNGVIANFADATGGYLPQVSTLNAADVLASTATMLGVDPAGLGELALLSTPGAHGLVFLPYLDGEQIPDLPHAAGTLTGLRAESMTSHHVARAAVEGMLCGLADGLDVLREAGVDISRVVLLGSAADIPVVRMIAPLAFGVPVFVPEPVNYVALGAARQAAWALSGQAGPPSWPKAQGSQEYGQGEMEIGYAIREQYRMARDQLHPEIALRHTPRRGRHRRSADLDEEPYLSL